MGFSTTDRFHLNGNTALEPTASLFPLPVSMSSENSLLIPLILSREPSMQSRSVLISYNEQAGHVTDSKTGDGFKDQVASGIKFTFPNKVCQQVIFKFIFYMIYCHRRVLMKTFRYHLQIKLFLIFVMISSVVVSIILMWWGQEVQLSRFGLTNQELEIFLLLFLVISLGFNYI